VNDVGKDLEPVYGTATELRVEEIAAVQKVLERVRARRFEWLRAAYWGALAALGVTFWFYGWPGGLLGFVVLLFSRKVEWDGLRRWARRSSDVDASVNRIERWDPRLEGRLKALHAQHRVQGEMSYVQWRLLQEVRLRASQGKWARSFSGFGEWVARMVRRLAALVFFAAWIATLLLPRRFEKSVKAGEQASAKALPSQVLPGNAEVEKGTRFTVTARYDQMRTGVCLVVTELGQEKMRLPMVQGLGEPVYGVSLEEVERDFEYWVESEAGRSERYRVGVFEFPKLERSDAVVSYPEGVEPRERFFGDARRLTVAEGSTVRWTLVFNKPVKAARLKPLEGEKEGVVRELGSSGGGVELAWVLGEIGVSVRGRLEVEDEQGRLSKMEPEFRVEVTPNQPPKVRPLMPSRDARFSAIEEIDFQAEVTDDTGLKRWGVTVQVGAEPAEELVLGRGGKGGETVRLWKHLELESRQVKAGDSLSWFFWAEDEMSGGKVRRVESDLMLGRIRAFEEEYRDGGEEEGEEGGKRPHLLELQKEVMAASWNLKRGLGGKGAWDEAGRKGVGTVEASERKVLELAEEGSQREQDSERLGVYQRAGDHLGKAVEALKAAASDVVRLDEALREERLAFDALAHLAPSAFEMKRSKSGRAGEMEERTRQMSQLEFAKQEDRYEQKRQAKTEEEDQERGELEKLLADLRALARRQEEIAERMRELEERMRNSKEEAEREASRRELKKLMEEQQTVARQLEEAQQRNAQQPNEGLAREAVQGAREAAQRAAESMGRGAMGEAGAAAARASESLRKGSDALRQQLSGRTREAARDLERQAREMKERQEAISEALQEEVKGPKKLAGSDVRKEAAEQQNRLKDLQGEMQRVAESVESSEPLFAKALQEAHRATMQSQLEGKLGVIRDAVALGRKDVARKAEAAASKDLGELTESLEKAAAEVLGEDAQALRAARAAVDELARSLGGSGDAVGPEKALAAEKRQESGAGPGAAPSQTLKGSEKSNGESKSQGMADSSGEGEGSGSKAGKSAIAGANGPEGAAPARGAGEGKADGRIPAAGGKGSSREGVGNGEAHGDSLKRGVGFSGGGDGVPAQELGSLLDQLDRIESLLEQPRLRAGVARAQRVAEELRGEMKRHATRPKSGEIESRLLAPLVQLREAISAELARREGREREETVDRDPVPRRFEEAVRRYYEALGGGR
jgi:hypothetical protein